MSVAATNRPPPSTTTTRAATAAGGVPAALDALGARFAKQCSELRVLAKRHAQLTGQHPLAAVTRVVLAAGDDWEQGPDPHAKDRQAKKMAASELPKLVPTPFERDLLTYVDQRGGLGAGANIKGFLKTMGRADLNLHQRLLVLHILRSTRQEVLLSFVGEKGLKSLRSWMKSGLGGLREPDRIVLLIQIMHVLLQLPTTLQQLLESKISRLVGQFSSIASKEPPVYDNLQLVALANRVVKHWSRVAEAAKKKKSKAGAAPAASAGSSGGPPKPSKAPKTEKPAKKQAPAAASGRGRSGASMARRQREAANRAGAAGAGPAAKRSRVSASNSAAAGRKAAAGATVAKQVAANTAVKRARSPEPVDASPPNKQRPVDDAVAGSPAAGFAPFRGKASPVVGAVEPAVGGAEAVAAAGTTGASTREATAANGSTTTKPQQQKKKKLTWAADKDLVEVVYFEKYLDSLADFHGDADEGAVLRARPKGASDDADDMWASGGSSGKRRTLDAVVPWRTPPVVRGYEPAPALVSTELGAQRARAAKTMEVIYRSGAPPPPNPSEDHAARRLADEPAPPTHEFVSFRAYEEPCETAEDVIKRRLGAPPAAAPASAAAPAASDITKLLQALKARPGGAAAAGVPASGGFSAGSAASSALPPALQFAQQHYGSSGAGRASAAPSSLMGPAPPQPPPGRLGVPAAAAGTGSLLGAPSSAPPSSAPPSAATSGLLPAPAFGAATSGARGPTYGGASLLGAPSADGAHRRRWDGAAQAQVQPALPPQPHQQQQQLQQQQQQGVSVCRYFGTPVGCMYGAQCRNFHDRQKFPAGY